MRTFIAAALRRLAHRLEPAPAPVLQIDVEEIVKVIKRRNRQRGEGSAGI